MAHYFHYIKNDTAPLKDLARLLDHLWEDELKDYAENPRPRHVFHQLVAVANWLNAGTTWTAEQYVEAWETSPEAKWLAARNDSGTPRAEERVAAEPAPSSTPPRWEYLGVGSRYKVQGRKPSVTVIVGWDRPLHTFYAQVWDVPEGVKHHERGELVLWAGTSWDEVHSVDDLAELLKDAAVLPEELLLRLERDRLPDLLDNLR